MKHTYGASAQAQLFGIRTVRADELNPGMPPVIGLNVDTGSPAMNTDIAVAVDSMVEQANSLGKVAASLIDRATRGDAENPFKPGDKVRDNYGKVKEVIAVNGSMVTTWSPTETGTLGNSYHWTKLHKQ
jgi:hypothetical protein